MSIRVMTPRGPVEAEPGLFQEAIRQVAQGVGMTKFRVFVNDLEVQSPAQAPERLEEGMAVTIFPYDIAA